MGTKSLATNAPAVCSAIAEITAAQHLDGSALQSVELQVHLDSVRSEQLAQPGLPREPNAVRVHHEVPDPSGTRYALHDPLELGVNGRLTPGQHDHVRRPTLGHVHCVEHRVDLFR